MFQKYQLKSGHVVTMGSVIKMGSDDFRHIPVEIEIYRENGDELKGCFLMHYNFFSVHLYELSENDLFLLYTYYDFIKRVDIETSIDLNEFRHCIKAFSEKVQGEMS